jgi:hypothetical protein
MASSKLLGLQTVVPLGSASYDDKALVGFKFYPNNTVLGQSVPSPTDPASHSL